MVFAWFWGLGAGSMLILMESDPLGTCAQEVISEHLLSMVFIWFWELVHFMDIDPLGT